MKAGEAKAATSGYDKQKTKTDEDDEDDPIAKSLKQRMKAGGLNEVVKVEGKQLSAKEKAQIAKEDAKKRMEEMKNGETKAAVSRYEKQKTKQEEDDEDDPIAKSLK